jgi:uncharacterized protein YjiS (DUF1127 family)
MRIPVFIHLPGDAMPLPSGSGLAAGLSRLAAQFRRWRADRRTFAELRALDDATLRDIGVTRWQLHSGMEDPRR